ncbi:MAG: LysR family transcriptional regulator [Chloroflexota bacterium]|nr:LysR family transcriptional regulator [Chloroflexota bacterium]NOG66052.1 LysR family transcriptional regulator [Chloroflexota bacterium]GIK67400.1 MAG: LysR family transcriptional regulator [Chloroflexota bacterium]
MELRQLRYLLVITEEQNFTRAAERLFITQPALTQQIQKLEQEVGSRLLDRSLRQIRLTPAGEILVHHARQIMQELAEASIALHELNGLQRGIITIGTVQTVNHYLLPTALAEFANRYPAIQLRVEERSADEIEAGVAEGHFQIGIAFVPALDAELETELLFEEDLVLIVGMNHPLAVYKTLPVANLNGLPLVHFPTGFCTRRLWEAAQQQAGIHTPISIEMNTVDGILSTIQRSGMATILPRLALHNTLSDAVRSIQLTDPTPRRGLGLLWRRGGYRCTATQAFAEVLKSSIGYLLST